MVKRPARVKIHVGADGQFYVTVYAGNGRVIADLSEGYSSPAAARRACRRLAAPDVAEALRQAADPAPQGAP